MINTNDRDILNRRGITEKEIKKQIKLLKNNNSFLLVKKAASLNDGIVCVSSENSERLIRNFDNRKDNLKLLKFVPASGAASRMFSEIHKFLATNNADITEFPNLKNIIDNRRNMAFYNDLCAKTEKNIEEIIENKDYKAFFELIIGAKGLNYDYLPKALLKFHTTNNRNLFCFEEHLFEGANYCVTENKSVNIHFTVSEDHLQLFKKQIAEVLPYYKTKFNLDFNINFSTQQKNTDTVALNSKGELLRDNGELVLRAGGHGALLKNIQNLDADIIFIKNIDNVCHQTKAQHTINDKKVLAELLLQIKNETDGICSGIKKDETIDCSGYTALCNDYNLSLKSITAFKSTKDIFEYFNRPIRICGMVKNTGEPGGGPFWVRNNDDLFLQIVEKSQIDTSNPQQNTIMQNATHFNPVDIVCSIKDYKGEKFDLTDFVDHNAVFLSDKKYKDEDIKIIEHPGLWNGAMAKWLTVFVEVAAESFSPVKQFSDLLKPQHRR